MSIKTTIAAAALAALTVAGSLASTTNSAEAKQPAWVWGVGAGIAATAVVGSAIAASNDPYYRGYHRCSWVAEYNALGQYIGRVRTCY